MQPISKGIAEILERAKRISQDTKVITLNTRDSSVHECHKCLDLGYIIDGNVARECSCLVQKRLRRRMKNAMIPDEFRDATLESYVAKTETQKIMLNAIRNYLDIFDTIFNTRRNSFGFIAVFGEQRLRKIKDPVERAEAKKQHNNYGLGKTHLQVAVAKELINRGYTVLVVSDVTLMEDLSQASRYEDGEDFERLIGAAIDADVLVWDDIGKAKPTESRQGWYYRLINERYKAQKPIIYSSNEDMDTLTERIGDDAASRLFGMSKGRIYQVEGPDYRLVGA